MTEQPEKTSTEEEEKKDKRQDFTQEVSYNVFKDGKNLHGKKVRQSIIDNFTKYYKVFID